MIHCIEASIGHLAVSGDRRSMSGVNPHRVHSSPHFCPAEAAKRNNTTNLEFGLVHKEQNHFVYSLKPVEVIAAGFLHVESSSCV